MRESLKDRIADHFLDSVVNNVVVVVVGVVGMGLYGWLSGSFEIVAAFVLAHPADAVVWVAFAFLLGFFVGQIVRIVYMEKSDKSQITRDLRSCTAPGLYMTMHLYLHNCTFAEKSIAEAGDALYRAGIVMCDPVEIDGVKRYCVSLRPEKRELYSKHERYFFGQAMKLDKRDVVKKMIDKRMA